MYSSNEPRSRLLAFLMATALLAACADARSASSDSAGENGDTRGSDEVRLSGTVFLDNNGNGRFDAGETGVAGAHVSDGDQIVSSDPDGRYAVTTTCAIPNTVFIINPDGFVHSGARYHVVSKPADNLDFGLTPEPPLVDGAFSFFHAADWQFGDPIGAQEQIQETLDELEAYADSNDVRFYTFVGDITSHGDLEHLRFFKERSDQLRRPFYAQFGGHDGIIEMERPKMGNFVEVFGPYAYAWNYGGVHFVALVTEGFLSDLERERQMRWWRRDMELLPPDKPVVILAHIPDPISAELREFGKRTNIAAVLFGHWHTHHQYEVDGVPLFTSSPWRPTDWGGFTRRARVFTFRRGELSSDVRVLEQKKRLTILSPGPTADPGTVTLSASVYDTVLVPKAVVATVKSTTDDRTWQQPLEQVDDWTWMSPLPEPLPSGSYALHVTVAGHENWTAQRTFTVADKATPIATGSDWPSLFGGDEQTRSCRAPLAPPLRLKWIASLGTPQPLLSSPIIVGGRICQGIGDGQAGSRNAGVVCIDPKSGKTVWKTSLPHDINATVCSDGRAVYALDCQGSVYALDAETGIEHWRTDAYASTDFHEINRYGWRTFMSPLTVDGGNVFAVGSRVLAGLDAAGGEPLWTNYNDLNAHAPYPMSGLAPRTGLGYFEDESKVAALRLDTGEVAWVRQLKELSGETARERGTSTPLVTQEGVYFHHRSHLRKLDRQTGEEMWTVRTGEGFNYVSTPAWADGKVVVGTGAKIVAVDAKTGDIVWTFGTRGAEATGLGEYQSLLNGSAPAIANGYVFVGSDDGFLYALKLDDGAKVWEYNTGTPIKASPAISGNLLIISNFAGQLFAFVPEASDAAQ